MTDDAFDADAYVSELRAKHEEGGDFFGSHPQSLIPPEKWGDFDGLDYSGPDPDYRATTLVETHTDPGPVTMDALTDGGVWYLRVATFHFELRDTDLALGAHRQEHDDSPTLFVPFRDKTTGQQICNDGRYTELTPDTPPNKLEGVVVDFNFTYNPLRAFTRTFECPSPSEENRFGVVTPAGERDCEQPGESKVQVPYRTFPGKPT